MSASEQELVNHIELPSKEDVERVGPAVGVCVCAFSKKPFYEPWSINKEDVTGLLSNPCTASDLVKKVLNPDFSSIKQKSEFEEEAILEKEIVIKHIDETLSNPMTGYLLNLGWVSEEEILQLRNIQKNLESSSEQFCNLGFTYPITTLLRRYLETSKLPRSLLLMGYQRGPSFNENADVEWANINEDEKVPEGAYFRVGGRFLSVNHPDVEERFSAADLAVKETKYYLSKKDQSKLIKAISPDLYTIFLGEVAKIPDSDKSLNAMYLAGAKYMEILMQPSVKNTSIDFLDYIPKQVLYMSLPGTAVTSGSKLYEGNSRLYQSLSVFWKPFGLNYEEKKLVFSKPDGETVVFGIIKRKE